MNVINLLTESTACKIRAYGTDTRRRTSSELRSQIYG